MPLGNGYGVVVGTLAHHGIEPPDSQGRWPHYEIFLNTPAGVYECVINLKSRSAIKIEERDYRQVRQSQFGAVTTLSNGFHGLAQVSGSGAFDAIRHPAVQPIRCGPTFGFPRGFPWVVQPRVRCSEWWRENGANVVELMEYYLLNAMRIFVWGEPYDSGLGMHNVHMNQGDPVGSPFAAENGIWQDGAVMVEYGGSQPHYSLLMTKFETQSLSTDSQGRSA